MLSYLLQGLSLGLSAAASPGPYQAYVLTQTLRAGWQRTIPAAFAPLITDGPIIALVLFLLTRVPAEFLKVVQIAGGFFVLYLSWNSLQAYRTFGQSQPQQAGKGRTSLFRAVLMNFLSPGPYLFWSLIAGPTLLRGWKTAPILGVAFVSGFYLALVGGMALLIAVFGAARQFGPKVNRMMLGVSTLALFGFGVYQLWQGFIA